MKRRTIQNICLHSLEKHELSDHTMDFLLQPRSPHFNLALETCSPCYNTSIIFTLIASTKKYTRISQISSFFATSNSISNISTQTKPTSTITQTPLLDSIKQAIIHNEITKDHPLTIGNPHHHSLSLPFRNRHTPALSFSQIYARAYYSCEKKRYTGAKVNKRRCQ